MLPVKEGKNKKLFFSCVKGPWLSPNVKNAHSFWSDCAEAVQGLSYFLPPPPPSVVTQKSMSELWRNNYWWEARALCCTGKKRKLQKQVASTPVFTRERPHWFIRTLFLVAHGTVMDSWELTMIHAKLISEISEARLMLEEFGASTPPIIHNISPAA